MPKPRIEVHYELEHEGYGDDTATVSIDSDMMSKLLYEYTVELAKVSKFIWSVRLVDARGITVKTWNREDYETRSEPRAIERPRD